jgi:hypothetical protein
MARQFPKVGLVQKRSAILIQIGVDGGGQHPNRRRRLQRFTTCCKGFHHSPGRSIRS